MIVLLLGSLHRRVFLAQASSSAASSQNWAVIVSSSRYWFNYRHSINALRIYQVLRDLGGYDDDHILLWMADEYAVNARNLYANQLLVQSKPSLFNATTQIDYRGDDVTIEALVQALTATSSSSSSANGPVVGGPRLESDRTSNLLVYWTGHGGDSFFKFQDVEEIMASDWARVVQLLYSHGKYQQLLFVADTCQAFSLGNALSRIPNVTWIGSALVGESSYSHHANYDLGLAVIDRYTYSLTERFWSLAHRPGRTITNHDQTNHPPLHGLGDMGEESLYQAMVQPFAYSTQRAHIGYNTTSKVPLRVADFFAAQTPQTRTTTMPKQSSRRRLRIVRNNR